jgi:subtilisin
MLKLTGAVAAGTILSTSTVSAAEVSGVTVTQRDGYELWTVQEGEKVVLEMGDGDTLENVLIDQTAPGAQFYVTAVGNPTGWAIRNVSWRGIGYVNDVPESWAGVFQMSLSGDGVVQNVFIDNRVPEGGRGETHIGGAYLIPHHSGHIDFRNTFIAGCGNNAVYASKPGDGGNGGTIAFTDCYHRDNTVSQFRIGTPGCRVRNSVAVLNDPDGRRGSYPGYAADNDSGKNARLVWGRHCDDMVTEDCAFHQDPDDVRPDAAFMTKTESESICDQNILTVRNFDINESIHDTRNGIEDTRAGGEVNIGSYGYNPTTDYLIEGVPMSPTEAARGSRHIPDVPEMGGSSTSSTTESSLDRTLTIDGSDAGWTDYQFTVSGEIENDPDTTMGSGDSIDGSTVTGFVNGGTDGYLFSGDVTDAFVDGDATVLVDGEPIDASTYRDTNPVVSTGGVSNVTDTSADLAGSLDDLGQASSVDVGFQYRASGTSDWTDTTTVTLSETGSFEQQASGLDGDTTYEYRAVAAASDGDSATGATAEFTTGNALNRTLTIDGSDAGWTDYQFTVSGEMENNPDVGTMGSGDSIDGSTVTGFVNGGTDGYLFSGDVTKSSIEGDATVLVDGEPIYSGSQSQETPPTVDRFEVVEAGSKNPHANITAEWDVSDADGDLSSVRVEAADSSGTVVDSATTSVSGDVAYDVDYFEIKHVRGETFDVTVTVTDAAGNSASATRTVQE